MLQVLEINKCFQILLRVQAQWNLQQMILKKFSENRPVVKIEIQEGEDVEMIVPLDETVELEQPKASAFDTSPSLDLT